MSDNELADWAEAWAAKRQTQRLPDVVSDNLRAIAARLRELSAEVESLRAAGTRLHDAVNAAEQPPTPQQDMDIDSALEAWEALGEES